MTRSMLTSNINEWTIKKLNSFSIEDLDNSYVLSKSDIIQYILLIMQQDNANNEKRNKFVYCTKVFQI